MGDKETIFHTRRDVTIHMAMRAAKKGKLLPVKVKASRLKLYESHKGRKA